MIILSAGDWKRISDALEKGSEVSIKSTKTGYAVYIYKAERLVELKTDNTEA